MIYATLDNFYLSDEQLLNSPSRLDGVDEGTENQLRQFGCDLIQEAGILLKLPQAVMATAQVLLQRFYCKKSLRKLDVKVFSSLFAPRSFCFDSVCYCCCCLDRVT